MKRLARAAKRLAKLTWRLFFVALLTLALALALLASGLWWLGTSPATAQMLLSWLAGGHVVTLSSLEIQPFSLRPALRARGLTVESISGQWRIQLQDLYAGLDLMGTLFHGQPELQRLTALEGEWVWLGAEPPSCQAVVAPAAHPNSPPLLADAFPLWLLRTERITLQRMRVTLPAAWQSACGLPALPAASAEFRNEGYQYRLRLELQWPASASPLAIAGLAFNARGGYADVELRTPTVPGIRTLAHWSAAPELKAEVHWRGLALQAANPAQPPSAWQEIDLRASARLWPGGDSRWHWETQDAKIAVNQSAWPALHLRGSIAPHNSQPWQPGTQALPGTQASPGTRALLWAESVPAQPVLNLLAGLDALPPRLRELQPSVTLRSLWLTRDAHNLQLDCGFAGYTQRAAGGLPGVRNLSGRLRLTGMEGRLLLDSRAVELHLPEQFSHPFIFNQLNGQIRWQAVDNTRVPGAGWQIDIPGLQFSDNAIAEATIHGRVTVGRTPALRASTSPEADLTIHVRDVKAVDIHRYLPDQAIPHTVHWLQHGLRAGRISSGQAVLRGPLAQFPFAHGNGVLQAQLAVEQVAVNYQPGWPELKKILGHVYIDGTALRVHARDAQVFDFHLTDTEVAIADMSADKPVLTANGQGVGTGADGLRFIRESPLQDQIDVGQNDLEIDGTIGLGLELVVPLYHAHGSTKGSITFQRGSNLRSRSMGLTLEHMRGQMHFDDASVGTENLRAMLFDQAVTLELSDGEDARGRFSRATLAGQADQDFLRKLFRHLDNEFAYLHWLDNLQGSAAWQADLDFLKKPPIATDSGQTAKTVDILVTSDLRGLATGLPPPLHKPADHAVPLRVRTRAGMAGGSGLTVRYDDWLAADLLPGLQQGSVRFGALARQEVTPEPGELRVSGELAQNARVSGNARVPGFDWEAWQPYLTPTQPTPGAAIPPATATPMVFALSARTAQAGGLQLHDAQLNARATPVPHTHATAWDATLASREIHGELRYDPEQRMAEVNLARVELTADNFLPSNPTARARQKSRWHPDDLPSVSFQCQELTVFGRKLGKLTWEAQSHAHGMQIQPLILQTGEAELHANGGWDAAANRTAMDAVLVAPDLGQWLARLAIATAEGKPFVREGPTRAEFQGSWAGAPWQFSLPVLEGRLQVNTGRGSVVEVEPGALARMFGLLDLQTLPQRLRLDFNDVFGHGLAFSAMEADVAIAHGLADAQRIRLDSPAAHIDLEGRVDLLQQQFGLRMNVTPHASNTLPVAGALLGGLGIGAAVLILQKILEPELEKNLSNPYTITGPWDNPQVEAIKESAETETDHGVP